MKGCVAAQSVCETVLRGNFTELGSSGQIPYAHILQLSLPAPLQAIVTRPGLGAALRAQPLASPRVADAWHTEELGVGRN